MIAASIFTLVDIKTTFGSFNNIALKFVKNDFKNKVQIYHLSLIQNYQEIKSLHIWQTKTIIDFTLNFRINETIFNQNQFSLSNKEIYQFVNEFTNLSVNFDYLYTNLYDINYLSSDYFKDLIENESNIYNPSWFAWFNEKSVFLPEFFFDKKIKKQFGVFEVVKIIYKSNVSGYLNNIFDEAKLKLTYIINGLEKTSELTLQKTELAINAEHLLLNIHSNYDFATKTINLTNFGIKGIYFPEKTKVRLELFLKKNHVMYKDLIYFNFAKNLLGKNGEFFLYLKSYQNSHEN